MEGVKEIFCFLQICNSYRNVNPNSSSLVKLGVQHRFLNVTDFEKEFQ
jgi:hypothetical protein